MEVKIRSALISVYNKDGLAPVISLLKEKDITIYSTGGTQKFIEENGGKCISVESLTSYPSILGGRVKTLHPSVFGGILGRREVESDRQEMAKYTIPEIDLVIVDLYPFTETVEATDDEKIIIEKIDIGGPSLIRAAAKNFQSVLVIADKDQYSDLQKIFDIQNGSTDLQQRKAFAAKAFDVCTQYDIAISNYFNKTTFPNLFSPLKKTLRYGENPHQEGAFSGDLDEIFTQLHGKELSYNNLVDADAALALLNDFENESKSFFAIIKHTNVCGAAVRDQTQEAFKAAIAGDSESAFGGVLISNKSINEETAHALSALFFEVLIAPDFNEEALKILQAKKNRIILKLLPAIPMKRHAKTLLNGWLIQNADDSNIKSWEEEGGRNSNENERSDLSFANIMCKHLKSNAIAIVKNKQLLGKGCGQTSRVDALRQAIEKANQFQNDLKYAVVASDAFFPFDDCVRIAYEAGITAFIQPGGSIRDKDSINFCKEHGLVMVLTGMRHFRH